MFWIEFEGEPLRYPTTGVVRRFTEAEALSLAADLGIFHIVNIHEVIGL